METRNTKWNKKVFALYTLNYGLLRSQKSSSTYYIYTTNYKKILRGRGLEKTRRGVGDILWKLAIILSC